MIYQLTTHLAKSILLNEIQKEYPEINDIFFKSINLGVEEINFEIRGTLNIDFFKIADNISKNKSYPYFDFDFNFSSEGDIHIKIYLNYSNE